eukprot:m.133017 g.133017  ORF g.133017 m.133017 type:complete len:135 (+) comp38096_c0_seq1:507-911(+)
MRISAYDSPSTILMLIATDEHYNRLNDFCTGYKLINWIEKELKDWNTMNSFVQKAKSLIDNDTHSSLLQNLFNCCNSYATLLFQSFNDLSLIVNACDKMCENPEASSLREQWKNCYFEESIELFQAMKSRIGHL